MKKVILVAFIFLSYGLATNAQQANNNLMQNKTTAKGIPISKIKLNDSHFLSAENELQIISNPEPEHDKDYYLKKSRNNRIASLCFAAGGFVIAGIGALSFPKDYDILFENSSEKESKANTSTGLLVFGTAAMLSSIPFTVMASVYKRKANLMVTSQKTGFGVPVPAKVSKDITGITLTIPIGK